jgi:hypothetical protein
VPKELLDHKEQQEMRVLKVLLDHKEQQETEELKEPQVAKVR